MSGIAESLGVAGLVAAGGVGLACWRQVVGVVRQASNYVVGRAGLKGDAGDAVFAYLASHKLPGVRERVFDGGNFFVREKRRRELVIFEMLSETVTFAWYRGVPVLLSRGVYNSNGPDRPMSVWWVRGTLNLTRLLDDAAAFVNERDHSTSTNSRFRIIRKLGSGTFARRMGSDGAKQERGIDFSGGRDDYDRERIRRGVYVPVSCKSADISVDATSDLRAFDVYSFDADVLACVDEVRQWHSSGDWYKDRGIPWTRGWLLTGKPGTGKTSLLRAIAQELDMPVYLFDLASMSNSEFVDAWNEVSTNSPCMAVFEDIDGVFHGRTNVLGEQGGGLTFDCLLNAVSGIAQSDGVFTAFTTNDMSKIDPAIAQPAGVGASRPGRVDRIIELGPMSLACRRRHAARVLGGLVGLDEIEAIVVQGDGMAAAQFNDVCVRAALDRFWRREADAVVGVREEAE